MGLVGQGGRRWRMKMIGVLVEMRETVVVLFNIRQSFQTSSYSGRGAFFKRIQLVDWLKGNKSLLIGLSETKQPIGCPSGCKHKG